MSSSESSVTSECGADLIRNVLSSNRRAWRLLARSLVGGIRAARTMAFPFLAKICILMGKYPAHRNGNCYSLRKPYLSALSCAFGPLGTAPWARLEAIISLVWSCGCGLWPWEKRVRGCPSSVTTMILVHTHLLGGVRLLTAVDPRLGCVCQTETGASRTVGVVTRKRTADCSRSWSGQERLAFSF